MSQKRTKMYTKKYIDNLFRDIFYTDPLIRLTKKNIQNSKSSIMNSGITKKVETKFKDDRISNANETSKDKKFKGKINSKVDEKFQENITSKAHIKYQGKNKFAAEESHINKRKLCADKIDVVKLLSSKKGNTDTPKDKGKTLKKVKTSKEDTKYMGNINSEADTSSKEEKKSKDYGISIGDKTSKENTNFKVNIKSKEQIKSKSDIKYQDQKKSATEESSNNTIKNGKILKKNITSENEESPKNNKKDNHTYPKKKFSNKKLKFRKDKKNSFKLVLYDEGETDTLQKKKTAKNVKISKTDKENQDIITHAEEESPNKKLMSSKDEIDVSKLTLSKEVESGTSKQESKTLNDDTMFKSNKMSKTGKKTKDIITHAEEESPNKKLMSSKDEIDVSKLTLIKEVESGTSKQESKTFNDDTMFKTNKISKIDKKTQDLLTRAKEESPYRKRMLIKVKIDVSKSTLSREVISNTSKENKTSKDNTMFKSNKITNTGKKIQDIITHAEEQPPNKKLKLCKNKMQVSKLAMSRGVESDTSKQEGKTSKDNTMFKSNKISKTGKKTQDIISHAEEEFLNKKLMSSNDEIDVSKLTLSKEVESHTSKEEVNTSIDDTMFKSNKISKTVKKTQDIITHAEEESPYRKMMFSKDEIDVSKLTLSKEVESHTSKVEVNTSMDDTMFKSNTISKTGKNIQDIITHEKEEEPPSKRLKLCKDKMKVCKLAMSKGVESGTSKQESKTLNDDTMFKSNKISKTVKKTQDIITHAEEEPPSKKLKLCKGKMQVCKLAMSKGVESGTSKQESKTFNVETMFKSNKISKTGKKTQDIISHAEEKSPNKKLKLCIDKNDFVIQQHVLPMEDGADALQKNETPKIDTLYMGNKISKEEYTNTKLMSSKDEIDDCKLTLSREFESDTSKQEGKTSKDDTMFKMFKSNKISKTSKKTQDIISHAEEKSPNKKLKLCIDKNDFVIQQHVLPMEDGADALQKNETPKIDTLYMGNKISKEEYTNTKLMSSKDEIDDCKLTLSREFESDTSKQEGKTSKDDTMFKMFKSNKISKTSKKTQDIISHAEEKSPNKKLKLCIDKNDFVIQQHVLPMEDGADALQKNETPKIDTLYKGNKISNEEYTNTKLKSCKDEIDVDKSILSGDGETHTFKSQFNTSIRPITEIASTITEKRSMVTDPEETAISKNSSVKNVVQRMQVIEPVGMMTKQNLSRRNRTVDLSKLLAIEKLYVKYFPKSIQVTIVIIANILNIILISNKYHQTRIDESFKKRSAAEKLRERCDADQLHEKHKTILETKLKNNFNIVLSVFTESEFDSAFQMFFLSILNVLRVLDQDSFKLGGVFGKLVRLLRNSLKNSKFNLPKMFSMFRSKTFHTDCIDKITVIDDSRYDDPGVVNRMELFFISTAISRKYFQGVINAVTRDSDEDLSILIDIATIQCCINSKFNDPVDSSTVQQSNDKIPVTETIQTPANSVETNQNRFIGNNPNKTYQQIPVLSKGPTIVNAAVEPQIVTRVVPIKANNSMMQFTTLSSEAVTSTPTTGLKVPCKPSPLFKKSVSYINLHNAVGSTVVIENNKYTLTKDPSGQLLAVSEANSTNILVQSPSTADIKCITKNCKNSVKVMCSRCEIAKYCDSKCQKRD